MAYPTDYPNGHKAWLEAEADKGNETKRAVCHAALYLGRILEVTTWTLGYATVGKKPPEWWLEGHPHPEEMEP